MNVENESWEKEEDFKGEGRKEKKPVMEQCDIKASSGKKRDQQTPGREGVPGSARGV